MEIAVKFCGGCNPRYDRGKSLKSLKKHFGDRVNFSVARLETSYDGLLVIAGCPSVCVEFDKIKYNAKEIVQSDKGDLPEIISKIEKLLGGY